MRNIQLLVLLGLVACTTPVQQDLLPEQSTANCISSPSWANAASRGAVVFDSSCAYCHQPDGGGIAGRVPALAGNEPLVADPVRGIRMILVTQSPAARLHGMEVRDLVAALGHLDHNAVADVMTYVVSSWGNCGRQLSINDVNGVASELEQ